MLILSPDPCHNVPAVYAWRVAFNFCSYLWVTISHVIGKFAIYWSRKLKTVLSWYFSYPLWWLIEIPVTQHLNWKGSLTLFMLAPSNLGLATMSSSVDFDTLSCLITYRSFDCLVDATFKKKKIKNVALLTVNHLATREILWSQLCFTKLLIHFMKIMLQTKPVSLLTRFHND